MTEPTSQSTELAILPRDAKEIVAAVAPMDIASLTESDFARGLERIETSKVRMARILDSVLVKDAHYGNPNNAFQKPILFQAGAEELSKGFRLQIHATAPDSLTVQPDFVQVTVHRAIYDISGRMIDQTTASCSTKEKRFKKRNGSGFVYEDARECLNDCYAMAEKRAKVRLVRSALGLTAFLANGEEMEDATEQDRPLTPMTDEERKKVYDAAQRAGLGKKAFTEFVHATLGRTEIGTGDDVTALLAAFAKRKQEQEPKEGASHAE